MKRLASNAYRAISPVDADCAQTLAKIIDGIVPAVRFGWLSGGRPPSRRCFCRRTRKPNGDLQCVVTAPAARRRGLMRALLSRLTAWAVAEGATAAGLFIVRGNDAARALYQRLGYEDLYSYSYWIAPAQ